MDFEQSKRAIAQIYYADGKAIAGTGFLIADRYVLTCAHVVKAALGDRGSYDGAELRVTFPNVDGQYTVQPCMGTVVFYALDEADYGADAAVLYLDEAVGAVSGYLALVPLDAYSGTPVQIYGFLRGEPQGLNISAVTEGGGIGKGWVQLKDPDVTGAAIEEGASGSPAWNEALQGAVGMIVAEDWVRGSAKIGFMIPTERLRAAQDAVMWHSLYTILEPYAASLEHVMRDAYQLCRPATWNHPVPVALRDILTDLAEMPEEGLSDSKVVQFAACLLNCPQAIEPVRIELNGWIANYTCDLGSLLSAMQQRQQERQTAPPEIEHPYLMISIEADRKTKQAPYQVAAWLIPNSRCYRVDTGEGAVQLFPDLDKLSEYPDAPAIDLEAGVTLEAIPYVLASYLEQVDERVIERCDLTIELFLPLSLINHPIEQRLIPALYGFPYPLGAGDDCPHVVLRAQDRLRERRAMSRWQQKWQQRPVADPSHAVLIPGNADLRQLAKDLKTAFGLKLPHCPQTGNQGEIGLLIATGTPIAVWVRCVVSGMATLDTQVLAAPLGKLPCHIQSLRRQAPELDDEIGLDTSTELGHHLSFLWEDPQRIPPTSKLQYSGASLS
jgi:hypothetical protein